MIGKNVRLRPFEESDLERVARWRNDPRVASQFFGCWPFVLSEQAAWYRAYVGDPTQRMWVIERLEGGEPIGTLALIDIDHRNQRAELGRVLVGCTNHLAGRSAQEAVDLIVHFAFKEANLRRIEVRVLSDNEAAIGLYEGCGFQREGILREAVWKAGVFRDILILARLRGTGE